MKPSEVLSKKYRLEVTVTLRDAEFNTLSRVENESTANIFALNAMSKALGKATVKLVVAATEGEAARLREEAEGGRNDFARMLAQAMGRGGNGDVDEDGPPF